MNQCMKRYIDEVCDKARTHNVNVKFGKGRKVRLSDGMNSSGFFDTLTLAVATKRSEKQWFPTFVHESCHLDQWLEKSHYWKNAKNSDYQVLYDFIADTKVIDYDRLLLAVNNIVMLEADCERRVCKKIQDYDLPINPESYAQRANSYLFFHKAIFEYGKWYKKPPYEIKEIINLMPLEVYKPEKYQLTKQKIDTSIFERCF